jgi:hypothetical protein
MTHRGSIYSVTPPVLVQEESTSYLQFTPSPHKTPLCLLLIQISISQSQQQHHHHHQQQPPTTATTANNNDNNNNLLFSALDALGIRLLAV